MSDLPNLLRRNIVSIFNQRDAAKRKAALSELWSHDGVFWTSDGAHLGRSAIAQAIASVHLQYPEFNFSLEEEVDEIPDVARVRWSFGARGRTPALSGLDIVVVKNRQINMMFRFLDGADL